MTDTTPKQPPPWGGRFSQRYAPRRFAAGDVHGCSRTLRTLVEDVLRIGKDDILYLLGDYIDRGPDSKGVLNYLMELYMGEYDIRPLRGNHEQLLLDSLNDSEAFTIWKGNGGYSTLKEFGVAHPSELPKRYLDFINHMPLTHLLDDYVLVHAGLDFRKVDPLTESTSEDMLWTRDCRFNSNKLGGRTLVTGHCRMPLSTIRESLQTCHIFLDNGCYSKGEIGEGALVALDLDTRQLIVVPNCD